MYVALTESCRAHYAPFSGLMTWIPLLRQPSRLTSLMCIMLTGKGLQLLIMSCLLLPELAQGKVCLGCVHTMLGVPGLPPCTARYSSSWHFRTRVCKLCINSDWAVTQCLGIWKAGLQCSGHRGSALFAMLVSPGMKSILSLGAKAWSVSVRPILGCLDNMLVH